MYSKLILCVTVFLISVVEGVGQEVARFQAITRERIDERVSRITLTRWRSF